MMRASAEVIALSFEKETYTMQEMADKLHVNKTTVYRYLKSKIH